MEQDTYIFPQGPQIAVHFLTTPDRGYRVRLVKSDEFSVSFFAKLEAPLTQEILEWISAYSERKPLPNLSLPRQILPPFSQAVVDKMLSIPFGKVLSYGEIAHLAGSSGASRAVGTICRTNPWPLFIPCHRVLPKTGGIGNYAFGLQIKELLLHFEGAL